MANMSFNAIRENKIFAKISEVTVSRYIIFTTRHDCSSVDRLHMTDALLTGLYKLNTNKQCVEMINKYKCINSEHGEYMY